MALNGSQPGADSVTSGAVVSILPAQSEATDSSSDFSDLEEPQKVPPDLRVFKLWYVASFSGVACIWPFLVLYYHRVGLSGGQIGILLAMQPVVSIPMGAIWGMLVDRTRKPKAVLMFTLVGASLCRFSIGWATTFWQLCVALAMAYAVGAPSTVLADVLALQALPDKSDYGKLRMWGAIGWGAMSPLAGLLIKVTDLHAIFYCHLALMSVCVGITSLLSVEEDRGDPQQQQKLQRMEELLPLLRQLFSSGSVVAFFAVVVVMGMAMGCMASYMFLYLEELGGDTALMGLTLTVMCVAEVPAMYLSGAAVRTFGIVGVLCIVLVCYIIRLLYYSVLWEPWMVLPIELLHGITFGWGFSVGTMHAGEIAPPGLAATTQGLFNAALFNVGSGLGSLVSGFIYERFGAVFLFRCMAGVVFGALLIFAPFSQYIKTSATSEERQSLLHEDQSNPLLVHVGNENQSRYGANEDHRLDEDTIFFSRTPDS